MRPLIAITALLLAAMLLGCTPAPAKGNFRECEPPNMIVNGDCCRDSDYDGECDTAAPTVVKTASATTSATAAPKLEGEILPKEEIACDDEAQTLSILLRNTGDKSWKLDGDLPWGAPGHIENVIAFFNQYQMNKKGGTYRDGKLLFGPGPLFSDACGTPILSPGQEARCSFTNVPLASPNYLGGTNEIRFQIPSQKGDAVAEFTC